MEIFEKCKIKKYSKSTKSYKVFFYWKYFILMIRIIYKKINEATSTEEKRLYEQELLFEEEQLKKQIERRSGPSPYLINTPREGKLCEMEDYRNKELNEQQVNDGESSTDDKMFKKWDKNYFEGVEENDLDKEERLNEQNKEEEKQMGFWGYEDNELPKEEVVDDDIKDGMTIW